MRRIAALAVGTLALLGVLTAPANAVPDPNCVVTEATALLDLSSVTVPPELPNPTGCLAP
ncbi:hypothetical protein GCM10018785_17460 [Streptomyces longispororuber]|uniref:Secreted protein n=1 Tax=Streptomyces longispororuber TaxID=68230 RepID=A0A919DJC2_9ACTN|nr:hypothetical protein [Streptomyces longispororuber]GHE48426.1 hypothetical protein GCM10018785_17460 [Streptomyces longispororuber]